jgi:hypothetical protein
MQKETTVIEVPSRSGLRGRLDRMLEEHTTKAHALRIVVTLIDEDDRRQALDAVPQKFAQAMTQRALANGHSSRTGTASTDTPKKRKKYKRLPPRERMDQIRAFLTDHPGATTDQIAKGIGVRSNSILKLARGVATPTRNSGKDQWAWTLKGTTRSLPVAGRKTKRKNTSWYQKTAISGKPLTLFLLEHLAEGKEHTAAEMAEQLAEAGSPIKSVRMLNGPLAASLSRNGMVKRGSTGGYRLTAKGATHMVALRSKLEATGVVQVGGYTA